MNIKKKVPAFTLMEVTIAMLIAGIAIGITYTAYHLVSASFISYKKKQTDVATYLTVNKLLNKDFLNAQLVVKSEEGLNITTEAGRISYVFKENYILRDQYALSTDTFKIPVKAIDYSFENAPCDVGSTIDLLHIEVQTEGQDLLLNFKKIYSAKDLFE